MGKYAGVNNVCATKGCGHFVADHTNLDPKTNEVDHDAAIRYGCHATGTGCQCKDFVDTGLEELAGTVGVSAASIELAALQAKIDAAKKAKLEKELADLTAGN